MAKIILHIDGETHEGEIASNQSILEYGEANGLDLPYSCRGGICSTCMCKKLNGEVEMETNMILTDGELDEGFILGCQSRVTSESIEVTYDE